MLNLKHSMIQEIRWNKWPEGNTYCHGWKRPYVRLSAPWWVVNKKDKQRGGRGPTNGLEGTICSMNLRENINDISKADFYNPQAGHYTHLNSFKYPILQLLQLSAERHVLKSVSYPKYIVQIEIGSFTWFLDYCHETMLSSNYLFFRWVTICPLQWSLVAYCLMMSIWDYNYSDQLMLLVKA